MLFLYRHFQHFNLLPTSLGFWIFMVFVYFQKVNSPSCKTSSQKKLIIIYASSFIVWFFFAPPFLFLSTLSLSFWLLVHVSNTHLFPQECNLCSLKFLEILILQLIGFMLLPIGLLVHVTFVIVHNLCRHYFILLVHGIVHHLVP
jgi:hypothetical protein